MKFDWNKIACHIDALRVFPRLFMLIITYILYSAWMWYFGLILPTAEQTGAVGSLTVAYFGFFNTYAKSGARWSPRSEMSEEEE